LPMSTLFRINLFATDYLLTREAMKWLWNHYVSDASRAPKAYSITSGPSRAATRSNAHSCACHDQANANSFDRAVKGFGSSLGITG
jgi:hypothetical protein